MISNGLLKWLFQNLTPNIPKDPLSIVAQYLDRTDVILCMHAGGIEPFTDVSLMTIAAKRGYTNLIRYYLTQPTISLDRAAIFAANNGHLEICVLLARNQYDWDDIAIHAAGKHFHIIEYMIANDIPLPFHITGYVSTIDQLKQLHLLTNNIDPRIMGRAARLNNIEMLEYAMQHDVPRKDACAQAVKRKNMVLLQWLIARDFARDHTAMTHAASLGDIPMLKFLRENGFPFHNMTMSAAARKGHIHVLQWMLECGYPIDVPSILHTGRMPADILRWAYAKGLVHPAQSKYILLHKRCTLETLQLLIQYGCVVTQDSLYRATAGSIECFRFLVEECGLKPDKNIINRAIMHGNNDIIQYCVDTGLQPEMDSLRRGHLKTLKLLHKFGCDIRRAWHSAIKEGSIAMLDYLRRNNIPFSGQYPGNMPAHIAAWWGRFMM